MTKEKVSCIIVDDEPIALALVEKYVNQTPFLELKEKFSNGIKAVEYLNDYSVDVVFSDIQMPDLSGIELSRVIPKSTKVIFTTAFDQYALEGFKVDALDYLLKPFNYEEFLKAALKAKEWIDLKDSQSTEKLPEKNFLFVKSDYKQIKIDLNEVELIEGLKDYVKIWLKGNSKAILTLMSLKKLTEELPSSQFMRIHKSYIIALDKINEIERNQVLIRDRRITVTDQYKEAFQTYISQNSL
ncbi:MAG: LytR/AlgR family response regulator transcription factor [Moheibacter sp.]